MTFYLIKDSARLDGYTVIGFVGQFVIAERPVPVEGEDEETEMHRIAVPVSNIDVLIEDTVGELEDMRRVHLSGWRAK